jgi:hypothetical protein
MGVTIEITVPDQATRDRLAHQWSRAVVVAPDEPAEGQAAARQGAEGNEASRDYGLATDVTFAALMATAGRRVNLHAGGVSDVRRRVLAVVAPSGTGKTTATIALARRLGYVSDETVSIDPAGIVAPHPKPLSVLVDPDRRTRGGWPAWSSCTGARRARAVWPGSARRTACCSSSSSRRRSRSSPARCTLCGP